MGVFDTARQLLDAGINVIPAVYQDKRPALQSWEKYQQERVPHLLAEKWFGGNKERNLLVVCGSVSRLLVLDLDNRAAGEWWRQFPGMGDAMDATTCVKTAKGYHFWFALGDGETYQSMQVAEDGRKFDLKCEGGLVIGPGSIHETGKQYRWVRDLSHLQPLPDAVRGYYDNRQDDEGAAVRSLFVDLIGSVPQGEGEGRNDWLARVAGHLAKWIPHKDAYEAMVYFVNDAMPEPLDEQEEVDKLIRSIWKGHQQRHIVADRIRPASFETGWLEGNGRQLITVVKVGDDEAMAPWSNFDIEVTGIIETDHGCSYRILLHREDGTSEDMLVEGEVFANINMLTKWLANHRLIVHTLPGDKWRQFKRQDRLYSYVASQDAPVCEAVDCLGWADGVGFVTHEGLLTREGMFENTQVVPHPKLRNWAKYSYGFVPEKEAQDVLREVLTFHDETVTAVFGSWWAACWLKAQITDKAALFPFMAIEAASESGKTKGFFNLMVQLNGNAAGQNQPTGAALRDAISAHRSGIVWIDDMSDASHLMDLLRQATSGGSHVKKGQDRTTQESVRLVAPIVISGEGFDGLQTEKALRDRAIVLDVQSPTGRRSLKNPKRQQWDDIVDLTQRYGGGDSPLNAVAGTLGGMFLECGDLVAGVRDLRIGSGRWGDKMAVLRVGARMLARVTEQDHWVDRVDAWCQGTRDFGNHNDLTMKILPQILIERGVQRTPKGGPPVYVDHRGTVWFHEESVTMVWAKMARGDRGYQLGGLESIRSQRKALGIHGPSVRKDTIVDSSGKKEQKRYFPCHSEVSGLILAQAGISLESDLSDGQMELE